MRGHRRHVPGDDLHHNRHLDSHCHDEGHHKTDQARQCQVKCDGLATERQVQRGQGREQPKRGEPGHQWAHVLVQAVDNSQKHTRLEGV